ncbi:hypothetical protein [Proteus mirabilis]|uniref:hypothetical protein n=1 Tax=Proteus mirabilis TaxID=584 RepID=UPI0034D68B48
MKKPKNTLSIRLPEATFQIVVDYTTVFFTRADIILAALLNFDRLCIDEKTNYLKYALELPKHILSIRLSQLYIELIDSYVTRNVGRAEVVNAAMLAFDALDIDTQHQYLDEAKVKNNEN